MTELPQPLPDAVRSRLMAVRRRVLTVQLSEILLLAATVILTCMMLAMLVDAVATLFSRVWRTILTVSAVAATLTGLEQSRLHYVTVAALDNANYIQAEQEFDGLMLEPA